MAGLPIVVRAVETDAEAEAFFRLCAQTFSPQTDQERTFDRWRRLVMEGPGFDRRQIRIALRDEAIVGGCVVYARTLLMPSARLGTSCIGLVATHEAYRRQGIARAVLEDAIRFACDQGHALLLLGGIPNFYHQFGFVDIFDGVEHAIDRRYILNQVPGPCTVRPATLEDAAALVALYERHHHRYSGSFTRTVAEQEHRLRLRTPDDPPILALAPDGEPCGYLFCRSAGDHARAEEAAADTWPAALALLQYQAHLLDAAPDPPAEIIWPLPGDSPTLYHLLDNITFPHTSPLPPYPQWYVVRSQMRHLPLAGWMARPAGLRLLVRELLPRWRLRQQHYIAHWPPTLALTVGGTTFLLEIRQGELQLVEQATASPESVHLSPEVFTQLLFGFRPATWAARQPGQQIPEDLIPLLEGLFPPGHTFVAASDAF